MYRQLQFCHGDGAELFGADDDLTLCLLCDETPADPLGDHSAFAGVPGGVLLRVYGSPVITGWGMLLGGVILGLLSRVWTQEVTLDPQTVLGILLIGVVGTAMAFTLYLQGVNDIGPVKTSLLSCAELVTAGVLTSVWLS